MSCSGWGRGSGQLCLAVCLLLVAIGSVSAFGLTPPAPESPTVLTSTWSRATYTYDSSNLLSNSRIVGDRAPGPSDQRPQVAAREGSAAVRGSGVAAKGGEDTVSLFKASQRGLGEGHYTNGYKPGDFPGNGAYFAREREIADSYAKHYGEGVIETRVPRGVYDEHFAPHEMRYLGTPPGTELAIPPGKLDLLSQFERTWFR